MAKNNQNCPDLSTLSVNQAHAIMNQVVQVMENLRAQKITCAQAKKMLQRIVARLDPSHEPVMGLKRTVIFKDCADNNGATAFFHYHATHVKTPTHNTGKKSYLQLAATVFNSPNRTQILARVPHEGEPRQVVNLHDRPIGGDTDISRAVSEVTGLEGQTTSDRLDHEVRPRDASTPVSGSNGRRNGNKNFGSPLDFADEEFEDGITQDGQCVDCGW